MACSGNKWDSPRIDGPGAAMDDTGTWSSLPCVLRGEHFAAESIGTDAERVSLSCKQPIDDVWLGAGLVLLEERSDGTAGALILAETRWPG